MTTTVLSGAIAATADTYPQGNDSPAEISQAIRNDDGTCPACGWFNCVHLPSTTPAPEPESWKPPLDCAAHERTTCLDCGQGVPPHIAAAWNAAKTCYACDGTGRLWRSIGAIVIPWTECPHCDGTGRYINNETMAHLGHVEDMYATGVTRPEDPEDKPKHQYVCNVITDVSHSKKPMLDNAQSFANVLTPLARGKEYRCRSPRVQLLTCTPDGADKTLLVDCAQCDHCREWRKHKIAVRFGLGKGSHEITLLRVTNFQWNDWDAAAKWADGMGRRQAGKRWRGLRKGPDGSPEVVMAYPCALEERVLELARSDCERKSLTLAVSVGPLTGDGLYALLDDEATRPEATRPEEDREDTKVKHYTSRFVDWPDFADQDSIYLYGESVLLPGPPSMEQSELNDFEKRVLNLAPEDAAFECATAWMDGIAIDPETMHSLADAVQDNEPEVVGELVASIRGQSWRDMAGWRGPKDLLTDAARWMSDPRNDRWRDAYAPVLTAAGMPYERWREWTAIDAGSA